MGWGEVLYLKEANPSYYTLFWFKSFIDNKFLLMYDIANIRQCFINTDTLTLSRTGNPKNGIKRPSTKVN